MRVVIDTNVWVSSFFGGMPKKVIDEWKEGRMTLCLSPAIVSEYAAVLERMGLKDEPELEELLSLFARGFHCLFTSRTPILHVIDRDPGDNKFLECAVALKALFIVSGDKDLTDLNEYMGIRVVTPKEFLNIRIDRK